MDVVQLSYYPKLKTVLSEKYQSEIQGILKHITPRLSGQCLNIYSVFIDVTNIQSDAPFNALGIRNSEKKLIEHLSSLIGFIYSEFSELPLYRRYNYCNYLKRVFEFFAYQREFQFRNIKLSPKVITENANDCISQYKTLRINILRLDYYSGWKCQSKDGELFNVYLSNVYDTYGCSFAKLIHTALFDFALTQKSTSLRSKLLQLTYLLNEFTEHSNTLDSLKYSLKAENSSLFMLNVFNTMLAKAIVKEQDIKSFTRKWSTSTIPTFIRCFIDTGVFDEPLKPFVTPSFKEPQNSKHVISVGGSFNEKEDRLFIGDIPIEIKDEQALELIEQRIDRHLEHIRIVSTQIVKDIMTRHDRNLIYRVKGEIKAYSCRSSKRHPIGPNHLDNTIASFYHHGFGLNRHYVNFLGFKNKRSELVCELALPTSKTLMAFAALLILEHPIITPSWLQEWVLFDKNDNQVGLQKSGQQWVAVSFKNRKGATLAQQEVILSEYSKSIVDWLIEHTRFARNALKAKGGSEWRYVMLTANVQKPRGIKDLNIFLSSISGYQKSLSVDSFDNNKSPVLLKPDAKKMASLVTMRSIRKARGLQIYLKTHSIKAVAESLGHKEVNLQLLNSYLPESLMAYFNTRWVRIFQNAIIFEALKDSQFLFDAIDFDEQALDEFLRNHRLGDLPEHLENASLGIENELSQVQIEKLDELVFTLSTPLFQVLIAIKEVVENAGVEDVYKPIITKWYESAVFILNHFSLTQKATTYRTPPKEALSLYYEAVNNPIDFIAFRKNILCL